MGEENGERSALSPTAAWSALTYDESLLKRVVVHYVYVEHLFSSGGPPDGEGHKTNLSFFPVSREYLPSPATLYFMSYCNMPSAKGVFDMVLSLRSNIGTSDILSYCKVTSW
jgi:hypothetical protein